MRELRTLSEAINLVLGPESEFGKSFRKASLFPYWFRGQSNVNWKVEPGAFRKGNDGNYLYDEYNMMYEMRLLSSGEFNKCSNILEWLVLTQHYGLPTRLLDWTESILVALYFGTKNDQVDGRLIVLDPSLLNSHSSLRRSRALCMPNFPDAVLRSDQSLCGQYDELKDRLRNSFTQGDFFTKYLEQIGENRIKEVLNLPIAVYPPRNNARITSQSGMFTLHGGDTFSVSHKSNFGTAISLGEIQENGLNIITDFIIPAECKFQIRNDLGRLGVHQVSLFPEFEYQASHIRQKWSRE